MDEFKEFDENSEIRFIEEGEDMAKAIGESLASGIVGNIPEGEDANGIISMPIPEGEMQLATDVVDVLIAKMTEYGYNTSVMLSPMEDSYEFVFSTR